MEYRNIRKIAVLGAGTMGLTSRSSSPPPDIRCPCTAGPRGPWNGPRLVRETQKEGAQALERIRTYTEIAPASASADWVIETVAEDPEVKKLVLETADC